MFALETKDLKEQVCVYHAQYLTFDHKTPKAAVQHLIQCINMNSESVCTLQVEDIDSEALKQDRINTLSQIDQLVMDLEVMC